ncbi:MAG: MarR family transcriptional regulator, partial [Eubacteriales bacterium]|nr:MarR family transcriptional regulator [Eubacteriales bacterium]
QYLLAILGSPEGLTPMELAKVCRKDKSAVSRALSEMSKEALVSKETGKPGQYGLRYILTDKGKSAATEVSLVAGRAVELASQGLCDEDRETLNKALDLLCKNLKEMSENGIEL